MKEIQHLAAECVPDFAWGHVHPNVQVVMKLVLVIAQMHVLKVVLVGVKIVAKVAVTVVLGAAAGVKTIAHLDVKQTVQLVLAIVLVDVQMLAKDVLVHVTVTVRVVAATVALDIVFKVVA